MGKINKVSFKSVAIWVVLIIIGLAFSLLNGMFATMGNMLTIGKQVAVYGIVSVGMTIVLITGGIDLTVGSVMALTGVVASLLITQYGWSPVPAMIASLLIGLVSGLITGAIVVVFKLPAMIATLGMMTALRGLAYMITNGLPVYGLPTGVAVFGQGMLFDTIPLPLLYMIAVFILGSLFLNRTYIGRYMYSIGGNEEASRLAGIDTKKVKILAYVINGLLSSFAGIILMSRINSGQPSGANGSEMDIITAAVLGGVSISGGEGSLSGVLAGSIIIGFISNGLIIAGVGDYPQMVIKGLVLILAVIIDTQTKKSSLKVK